jgi:long-subunit acyl-CoA synthetase (AMP-forming)
VRTELPGGGSRARPHARDAIRQDDVLRSRLEASGSPEPIGSFLRRNLVRYGPRPALVQPKAGVFQPVSWQAFVRDIVAFGRFLGSAGVGPGDRVLVCSPNRGEMLVVEMATMCLGAVYVPIFAGYAGAQARQLVEHAGPTVLVVPGRDQLERTGVPASVRQLVLFDGLDAGPAGSWPSDVIPTAFDDVLRANSASDPASITAFLHSAAECDPAAPALMMYTSGTSGALKGVLLTHDNVLSQQRALAALWSITPDDRFLSYLPWHHSFGGIFEKYSALYNGATLYLDDSLGRDFALLVRNWKAHPPTVYFSVPKVYQQLVAHAETHPEDEAVIFHPGLRFVFTAAAPLPANLSAYFASRRIDVIEGWGLTETSPCCTLTDPHEARRVPGMVGYPLPGVSIRLAPDGEILVQGPNVMRGYCRDPEATARALPGDGWFHTGDLGELVGAGLRLVARKDRVFKMLNAEKVVPTEIENLLAGMNRYIRHVIVAGAGRGFLAALIFPDYFRITEEFGADRAAADREVKESLRQTLLAFNAQHPVKYEHIQAFAIMTRELSIEHEELTPSLKVRVHNVLQEAGEYLEAIYHPTEDCDCRFLRKVMRVAGDSRHCFAGLDRTLDRCHECGGFVFDDAAAQTSSATRKA